MLTDKSKHILTQTAESIEEIVENARSIHGDSFADFLVFVNRNSGVIKLLATARHMPDEHADQVMNVVCDLMGRSAADYGKALRLTKAQVNDALNLCGTVQERIRSVEQAVSKGL